MVVASHERPLRLRWLLNALEDQTLPRERWEVVVAHDLSDAQTERLLGTHPLARAGTLRHLTSARWPGPSAKRNAGWRAARAPLVAFTDDDCRPPRDWLASALVAASAHPGAIIQGATRPDPDELVIRLHAPYARTIEVEPPVDWAQTSNIIYPRAVLEAVDGFDEELPGPAGEDTDLALRARAQGADYVGAPEVLTYHCVEDGWLGDAVTRAWRWQNVAGVVARHPQVRRAMPLRVFWKPSHATMTLGLAGLATALARHRALWALLVLPWVRHTLPSYGASPRGRARALLEVPGHALVDLAELAALARGSVRHRTLLL